VDDFRRRDARLRPFAAADVHVSPATANVFFDSGFLPGGRYQLRNATLVNLVGEAFEIDAESVREGRRGSILIASTSSPKPRQNPRKPNGPPCFDHCSPNASSWSFTKTRSR
jgi:hypothetical protein